jgi:hypothetical protein
LCWWCGFGGVVDAQLERSGWSDGDYARTKLDADGDIVVWREAALAEADCELPGVSIPVQEVSAKNVHSIYRIQSLLATQSSLCSPRVETCGVVSLTGNVSTVAERRRLAGLEGGEDTVETKMLR